MLEEIFFNLGIVSSGVAIGTLSIGILHNYTHKTEKPVNNE